MIEFDVMELGDCFTPRELVDEIFRQCPNLTLPVPIREIASAVGISAIQPMAADDVEGMLVADETKSHGVIFYRQKSPEGRQRFTIGHELGHFLLLHHGARQNCLPSDIRAMFGSSTLQQLEAEANEFSERLLMPDSEVERSINGVAPTLEALRIIESEFGMSFEAIANKCATFSRKPFALVYSKDGIVRYCWKNNTKFQYWIPLKKGDPLPSGGLSLDSSQQEKISNLIEVNPQVWLGDSQRCPFPNTFLEQTYTQKDGYQVTLLCPAF